MPPFAQDAMGDVFKGDPVQLFYNAYHIFQETGIPLSATFNNIYVRPDLENLDLFVRNFRQLYEAGVKTVTIPHTSWVSTGILHREFPELKIKNTILRNVSRANEIVALAEVGFHYINLDRDLMRDRDALIRVKKAKDFCASIGKPVEISILTNEGCWGGCPMMDEHYHFNSTRNEDSPQYFMDPISTNSCAKWDIEDNAHALKAANLPPWKSDWNEFLDLGIDVFKMHGRENAMKLKESMDIISAWGNEKIEVMYPEFNKYLDDLAIKDRPIDVWRNKIKNCKFDCWDCNYCEIVVDTHLKKQERNTEMDEFVRRTIKAIDDGMTKQSNFNPDGFTPQGLSSDRIRHFLNSLCSYEDAVYLEVGTHVGSTFFAATMNNNVKCFGVDDFSEANVKPLTDHIQWTPCNPYDTLVSNWEKYENGNAVFLKSSIEELTDEDFEGSKPNILFYDASHDMMEQLSSLNHLLPFLDDQFILVVDDANFDGVVEATMDFVSENQLEVFFERKILSGIIENPNHWWNGIHVLVLRKDTLVNNYFGTNRDASQYETY
tara:strand:- start:7676 stop:9319 length:1644 start_codon:yes stop_codon:yes gene_type:complete